MNVSLEMASYSSFLIDDPKNEKRNLTTESMASNFACDA